MSTQPFCPLTTALFALADLCEALPGTEVFDAPGVSAAVNTLVAAFVKSVDGRPFAVPGDSAGRAEFLRALANQNEGLL